MAAIQLRRGGQVVPYSLPDTWSIRQAATAIASLEGAAQGVEWWYADWRLWDNTDGAAAPMLAASSDAPNSKMSDPDAALSTLNGHTMLLAWMNQPEFWN